MSDPSKIETNQKLDPVAHDRQTALSPRGKARRRGWTAYGRATPSLRQSTPGTFSSRLTLLSHLDCRRAPIPLPDAADEG